MRTEIVQSARELADIGVDSFVTDPMHTSWYLMAHERSGVGRREPRHIVVLDSSRPVAYVPCYVQHSAVYDDLAIVLATPTLRRAIRWAALIGAFPGLSPALLCSSPDSLYTTLSISPALERSEEANVVRAVVDALLQVARDEELDVVGFMNLPRRESLLWQALPSMGFIYSKRVPSAYLPVNFRTFEEYLRLGARKRRKQYKIEVKRAAQQGLIIHEIEDYSGLGGLLSDILGETWGVRGKTSPFPPSYFESLAEHTKGRSCVISGSFRGEVDGFTLLLWTAEEMCAYQYGARKKERVRLSNLYFNICYNATIAKAISLGVKSIRFGPGSLHVKTSRGCLLEDLGMFLKPMKRIHLPAFKALMLRNRRRGRAAQDVRGLPA